MRQAHPTNTVDVCRRPPWGLRVSLTVGQHPVLRQDSSARACWRTEQSRVRFRSRIPTLAPATLNGVRYGMSTFVQTVQRCTRSFGHAEQAHPKWRRQASAAEIRVRIARLTARAPAATHAQLSATLSRIRRLSQLRHASTTYAHLAGPHHRRQGHRT